MRIDLDESRFFSLAELNLGIRYNHLSVICQRVQ